MAEYSGLVEYINSNVYENTEQKITGTAMNNTLNRMVAELGKVTRTPRVMRR